jgi:hypothetical protein
MCNTVGTYFHTVGIIVHRLYGSWCVCKFRGIKVMRNKDDIFSGHKGYDILFYTLQGSSSSLIDS